MSDASRRVTRFSWAMLVLVLLGLWRFTTLGARTAPGLEPCTGCAAHGSAPLRRAPAQRLLLLADARIDGRPASLLVDTGTSETLLDRGFAGGMGALGRARRVLGAVNESFGILPLAHLGRLELAGLAFTDFEALVVDLAPVSDALGTPVAGILGWNVLGRSAVEIDFAAPSLAFDRGSGGPLAERVARDPSAFAVRSVGGGVFASVALGRVSGEFLVDSGAAPTRIGEALARLAGATAPVRAVREVRDVTGGRLEDVASVALPPLRLGLVVRKGLRADLGPSNLLGADVLEGAVLRIDAASDLATLEVPATAP